MASVTVDNNFIGWKHAATLRWPETGRRLRMTAQPPLSYLVVYTPPTLSMYVRIASIASASCGATPAWSEWKLKTRCRRSSSKNDANFESKRLKPPLRIIREIGRHRRAAWNAPL